MLRNEIPNSTIFDHLGLDDVIPGIEYPETSNIPSEINSNSYIYNPFSGDNKKYVYELGGALVLQRVEFLECTSHGIYLDDQKRKIVTSHKFNNEYRRVYFHTGQEVSLNSRIDIDENGLESVSGNRVITIKEFNRKHYYNDTFELVPREMLDLLNKRKDKNGRTIITEESFHEREFQYLTGKSKVSKDDYATITHKLIDGLIHLYVDSDEIMPVKNPTAKRKKAPETSKQNPTSKRRKKNSEKEEKLVETSDSNGATSQTLQTESSNNSPALTETNHLPSINNNSPKPPSSNEFYSAEDFVAFERVNPKLFKLFSEMEKCKRAETPSTNSSQPLYTVQDYLSLNDELQENPKPFQLYTQIEHSKQSEAKTASSSKTEMYKGNSQTLFAGSKTKSQEVKKISPMQLTHRPGE